MKAIYKKYTQLSQPLKASLWFTICSTLQKAISFITVPVFTRLLTTDQYGLFNVYQSWLQIITIFATLNLAAGVFNNGMIKYDDDRDRYTSAMQGLSTTVTVSLFLICLTFNGLWQTITQLPLVLLFAMFAEMLFVPAFNYWAARQRFEYRYRKLVVLTLIVSILNPIVGILSVLSTEDKGVARIVSATLVQVCIYLVIYIHNAVKGKKFFAKQYWKFAIAFNIPLIPHYLSSIVLGQSDRIMINYFCGTGAAGVYSVAFSVAMVMNIVSQGINSSFVPWTYQKLKKQKYKDIGNISNFILLLVGAAIIFLVAFAPEIIKIMAPAEYYEAIWIIPAVALNTYFAFLYSLFANIEFYYEENIFIAIASILAALANITLNAIFIPIVGYLAAGYTSLTCYIIYSITHYIFMTKVCRKHINGLKIYNVRFIIFFSIGLIIASFLLMFVYDHIILRYLFVSIVLMILYIKRNFIMEKLRSIKN